MVLIIKHIEEVTIERMNVLHLGEVVKDVGKPFVDGLLAEFDLNKWMGTFRM